MLDALRAPPVPPARDLQVPEDALMDLDAPLLKRSRDTPSSTQPSGFTNSKEFAQRAQTASVPLPRTPEQVVLAPETPFQPVPHAKRAATTPCLRLHHSKDFHEERRRP